MGNAKYLDDMLTSASSLDEELTPQECYQALYECFSSLLSKQMKHLLDNYEEQSLKITVEHNTPIEYIENNLDSDMVETFESDDEDFIYAKGSGLDYDYIEQYEIAMARVQVRKIAQQLVSSLSRYRRRSKIQNQIDFRRSMRKSIETGGILIDLQYKNNIRRKPRLLFILDTSGSMQAWVRLLIQLIQAIGLELTKKEIFIFAHDLERVTDDIKKDWMETANVLKGKKYWGGTTSISTAIETLQRDYRNYITSQTVILLMSDLCTEDPELAAEKVGFLSHRVKSVFIFHTINENEEENDDKYVTPFIGKTDGLFHIRSLNDMAEAVKRVIIR